MRHGEHSASHDTSTNWPWEQHPIEQHDSKDGPEGVSYALCHARSRTRLSSNFQEMGFGRSLGFLYLEDRLFLFFSSIFRTDELSWPKIMPGKTRNGPAFPALQGMEEPSCLASPGEQAGAATNGMMQTEDTTISAFLRIFFPNSEACHFLNKKNPTTRQSLSPCSPGYITYNPEKTNCSLSLVPCQRL